MHEVGVIKMSELFHRQVQLVPGLSGGLLQRYGLRLGRVTEFGLHFVLLKEVLDCVGLNIFIMEVLDLILVCIFFFYFKLSFYNLIM